MYVKSIRPPKGLIQGNQNGFAGANCKRQKQIRHGKAWIFLAIVLISLPFCRTAKADYFPPALPASNIAGQTLVSSALTTPASTVYINVTQYDAQQMVKNITVNFREPISYASLMIDLLKEKPLIVNAPKTAPIIQYFDIRYLTELTDKISNVTVDFALAKATLQNASVEEDSLLLYQHNGSTFVVCPIQKVAENETCLWFSTKTTAYPLFVITGSAEPSPWWSSLLPILSVPFLAIMGLYFYRKYKVKRPPSQERT